MKINDYSVRMIVQFFYLMGYENYAKEMGDAWDNYAQAAQRLFQTNYYKPDDVEELGVGVKEKNAVYESTAAELKKTFNKLVSKTAVMTDEAKWKRCAI